MKRIDLHSVGAALAAAAVFGMAGVVGVLGVSRPAIAQEFPTKPVRLVIPNAAGSATDLLARVIGNGMSKHLGQPFIVDPRPGGSAVIGTDYVAKQVPADGYTLLVAAHTILVFPLFTKDPTSDPARDLVPVTLLGETGFALAAHTSMPFSSFGDFIGYAKANPGKLNFATGGPQSSITLVLELIKQRGGVDIVNIPYQGSGQIYTALLANTVQVSAGITTGQAAAAVKEGRLKALAVSGARRHPALPEVPSFGELGYPEIVNATYRLLAPAATPKPIIDKLYSAVTAALQTQEAKDGFGKLGFSIVGSNPEVSAKAYVAEAAAYAAIVRNAGLGPK